MSQLASAKSSWTNLHSDLYLTALVRTLTDYVAPHLTSTISSTLFGKQVKCFPPQTEQLLSEAGRHSNAASSSAMHTQEWRGAEGKPFLNLCMWPFVTTSKRWSKQTKSKNTDTQRPGASPQRSYLILFDFIGGKKVTMVHSGTKLCSRRGASYRWLAWRSRRDVTALTTCCTTSICPTRSPPSPTTPSNVISLCLLPSTAAETRHYIF